MRFPCAAGLIFAAATVASAQAAATWSTKVEPVL